MRKYLGILFLLFWLITCKTGKVAKTSAKKTTKTPTKESFEQFNDKFHQDSVFQLSRLAFPLGGYNDENGSKATWKAGNWIQHKAKVGEMANLQGYKYTLDKTDSSVAEKIWVEGGIFSFERKFMLKKKKWYLVYCTNTGW